MDTLSNVFRPRIGLGVGTMTYYGEVQNYQKGFVPMVNRYYGQAYVNAPLTKYFNIEFSASYGKIAANERSLVKNLNFESRIRMASVQLFYNFYPLFTNRRSLFHPFVGAGFSSFEFLSKTDMYDANGNQYYYWSDGSIMNMAEDDPNATNAVNLQRDYTYETDLREQDLDSLGDYREQSFSIPLSAGIEFHLSPRWDFRISTTYHLTFTDLIDNITPAGQGPERHGDSKNDMLWTTYVSLSYDLQFGEKEFDPTGDDPADWLYADFENNDWDKDGVIDAHDKCADTPIEALVDDDGCPLDGDGDGVPDYKDDELDTPEGNYVDEYGVTLTEEDIAKHWREYNDSTGYDHDFVEDKKVVEFGKEGLFTLVDPYADNKNKSYVIIIGKEHKDVAANELHEYLGFNDFKTEVRGDTVYYILGEYTKIEDAVAYANSLKEQNIDVELIAREGSNDAYIPINDKVIDKVEQDNLANNKVTPTFENEHKDEQVFRIQIGAFKKKINAETQFPGLEVTYATGKDGITRYYVGNHDNYEDANRERLKLISKGYRSAFVVAYEGGDRKTLKELGIDPNKLPDNYNEDKELNTFVEPRDNDENGSNIVNGIDLSKVKYRVRLARYEGNVPTEDLDILFNIGGVKPFRDFDGSTTYYSRKFESPEEATAAMDEYKTYGLDQMVPVAEYDGKYYTMEEFNEMIKQ